MAPKRTSIVWKFFHKTSNDMAECVMCKREIKHNSSTTNLRDHLQRKHPECLTLKTQDDGSDIIVINPNASTMHQSSIESSVVQTQEQVLDLFHDIGDVKMPPKNSSPLWQYFDRVDGIIAICKLCSKSIRYHCSTSNLKTHLKRKHPDKGEIKSEENEFAQTIIFDAQTIAEIKSGYSPNGTSGETSGGEHVIYKISEEKQVFNYHKLVVPMSMRSVYWKCFGFPANADGEVLTKSKIICLICKNVISYNRNTSNLRMHLQNKHQAELQQLESTATPRTKRDTKNKKLKKAVGNVYMTEMNGTLVIGGNNDNANSSMLEDYNATVHLESSEGGPSHQSKGSGKQVTLVVPGGESQSCTIESLHPFMIPVDSKSVCDAISEFVVTDLQLPDIVEGRGFQRLIATLKSPCEIPSRSKLMDEVIPSTYDKYKEALQETLLNLKTDVALTMEEWESSTRETYITFSVCFQQESDHNLVSRVLTTVHCPPGGDVSFWNLTIDSMLEEWNIRETRVRAVVSGTCRSDIINTMVAKGLIVLPCMVQTLQDVCSKVCFEQDDVREILAKCRAYICTVYKHNNALAALRIQDHLMSLEETPLMCDYPRVWISTYQMLESFMARRQVLSSILDNVESATFDRDAVTLSESDWSLLEDVVNVLEPFKVTAMTLSEEKAPMVSLIKPLLWQLLSSHLKEKPEDSMNAQVFKGALKTLLSEKYSEPAVEQLLQIATTMDPRFKTLPNSTEECRNTLGGPIKEALTSLIESTPEDIKPITDSPPEKKKPRLSGMMMLLGEMNTATTGVSDMSAHDRASLEIIQYQSEPTAALDQCPVTWWGRVAAKCPWLARLAHQYMCVPATAIPPARLSTEAQVTYDIRRANLTPEIVDRLIFLNSSH